MSLWRWSGSADVGKYILTNYLVGEKVAIVTKKPQTTRSRITGIITKEHGAYVLMDTPGIHAARNKLDARMTQTAAASLKDVDVTMMLFEPAGEFTDAELTMVKALQKGGPAIAVINKVDLLDNFAALEARKKQLEEFGCLTTSSRSRLRTARAAMNCLPCSSPTATRARTISTMTPSPICRRRSLSQTRAREGTAFPA